MIRHVDDIIIDDALCFETSTCDCARCRLKEEPPMPHWDYECPCCGRTEESPKTRLMCNLCAQKHRAVLMQRLPSAPNFVLKGAGFHKNDYPKKDR